MGRWSPTVVQEAPRRSGVHPLSEALDMAVALNDRRRARAVQDDEMEARRRAEQRQVSEIEYNRGRAAQQDSLAAMDRERRLVDEGWGMEHDPAKPPDQQPKASGTNPPAEGQPNAAPIDPKLAARFAEVDAVAESMYPDGGVESITDPYSGRRYVRNLRRQYVASERAKALDDWRAEKRDDEKFKVQMELERERTERMIKEMQLQAPWRMTTANAAMLRAQNSTELTEKDKRDRYGPRQAGQEGLNALRDRAMRELRATGGVGPAAAQARQTLQDVSPEELQKKGVTHGTQYQGNLNQMLTALTAQYKGAIDAAERAKNTEERKRLLLELRDKQVALYRYHMGLDRVTADVPPGFDIP